ncbi:hypothetical protein FGG08_004092 [Glutinoglossum americanum]|uniref:Uncharacterized protein n=1 Tax=Glutinoglossum americanum TaxID=1670608 RepID=A0A9P8KXE8_9PEZI|nr:hypothetical protein FGG08_004092 [Glutinoglossum americanum]
MPVANNFWGKEDAGVQPLLERMHNAKITCDELKAFYTARATMEDEYSRKLLTLSRKPLGSQEAGTLRASLDVMRGEVESMGKAHQNIAGQMKSELEEPLAAFSGGMKERRKIVQNGIEKLLKLKIQQTQTVNKVCRAVNFPYKPGEHWLMTYQTRDRFEQDCLRIKGYLAQGHMVMGQEERKNKAKLEKTQIQVAASNTEYENAVKALEETTGRWNRDWKAACDKFQDLEEERLDFMKSSLWSFANIASTVCVSDDASCEKIRLALENCEVEKDISIFIRERGTGQEIPDPPKYINFCRGDLNDSQSETSEDESYSVAQFQRTINPAFRSSSPQPSTYESHHDPDSALAMQMSHKEPQPHTPPSRETTVTPQKVIQQANRTAQLDYQQANQPVQLEFQKASKPALPDYQMPSKPAQLDYQRKQPAQLDYNQVQKHGQLQPVPHNEYPPDGMTMYCRTGPPSERSSAASPARPSSRDSQSEYSNPTSLSSQEPPSGKQSPTKYGNGAMVASTGVEGKQVQKKKSGFFQSHSPFRRKSRSERDSRAREQQQQQQPAIMPPPGTRNTWSSASARNVASATGSPTRRSPMYGQGKESQAMVLGGDRRSGSPEPVDPRASFQLNVGNNVFDVATPDKKKSAQRAPENNQDELDPIAQALAELKGVTKQSSVRMSADRYHGLTTPAPPSTPGVGIPAPVVNGALSAAQRGTPPPSYEQPIKRLDLPQPAFTSAQMQQTRKKYVDQTQNMLTGPPAIKDSPSSRQYDNLPQSRPGTRGGSGGSQEIVRATSPLPTRSVSPRPSVFGDQRQGHRSASPSPYSNGSHSRPVSVSPTKRGPDQGYYARQTSPGETNRAVSPQPSFRQEQQRPSSSGTHEMQLQLAPGPEEGYGGSQRGRSTPGNARPVSYYGGDQVQLREGYGAPQQQGGRVRSKSIADSRQFTRDGRPILHYARAMYMYQAAIPEELSFAKGDILAVSRLQDDGWWEAEVDIALAPFRIAVSKPAQRAYVGTILFFLAGLVLFGLAVVAYVLFYYNFIPQIGVERVVHLQFGSGNPYGFASLGQGLISQQAYDVYIHLELPRSPPNLAAGNFMLDLSLISPDSAALLTAPPETDILAHTRRPAILTYASPLVDTVNKIAEVPFFVLGFKKEAEKLDIRMMEGLQFARGWRNVPKSIRIEVQADEKMQIYNARVRFAARFAGLRWIMYNHRIISFLTGTTLFWFIELSFSAIAWFILSQYMAPHPNKTEPDDNNPTIKPEPDTDSPTDELSDTPRTFPTFSRQPPLQYPTPHSTPGAEDVTEGGEEGEDFGGEPVVGEADDEAEYETGVFSGDATFDGRPIDSGVGTSLSEAGGRGLQRRSRGSQA